LMLLPCLAEQEEEEGEPKATRGWSGCKCIEPH
jgi:hypothetical protein